MKKNYILSFLLTFLISFAIQAQTITQTYSAGDIPTSEGSSYSPTCTGPLTTLTLQLPAGGPWEVTGFDVEYDMTAANGAYMSEQRSLIHFQNNGAQESEASGAGSTIGTYSYNRTNIGFANDYYAGGTNLIFEMRAWRTWSSFEQDGCITYNNKVDNNTWTITVHYQLAPSCIAPTDIEVSNITVNSAEVSWTEIGAGLQWNLEYGLEGFTPGTGTPIVAMSQIQPITGLTDLTKYDVYIQSDCGGGDESAWVGPITFKTAADCSLYTLEVTDTTDGSVVCKGVTTLTATGSGDPNAEIYWFDAAADGNIVGTGNTFQTPILTTTTSYWAAEVIVDGGGGGSGGQTYCTPTYSTGCTSSDDIDNFIMLDAGINHIGSGCSAGAYGDFTNDPSLTGILIPGETYGFQATHNFGNQWLKIWIDLDGNGSFEDAGELLFTSASGTNNTTGSITIPASAQAGASVMRVMGRYAGSPISSCNPGGTFGETHDYLVIIGEILCESPREEVIATVTQDGDEVVGPLPYVHSTTASNYGNTFAGSPGGSCGTTENYLNGNDVVYQYSPANNIAINIMLSNLSGFYAGVFVYNTCGDIGSACITGAVNGPSSSNFGVVDLELTGGEDYYIVVSSWLNPDIDYTLTISESICPQPSNLQVSNVVINGADFSWDPSSNELDGYEWAVMSQGQHPDSNTPVLTNQTATGTTNVNVTGLSSNVAYAFYVRTDCGVTDGLSGWTGPVNFQTPITGATCEAAIEVTSLPYTDSGNTANFGDNYDGSPGGACGSTFSYLGGDDVVYHFNPSVDMTVNISLANLTNTYAGVFVYTSCANIGVSCFAGAVNGFSSEDLDIENLFVQGGQDYYILISTWPSPQSVGYTLNITRITCGSPGNLQMDSLTMNDVDFSWNASAEETGGYGWVLVNQGENPDNPMPVQSGTTSTGIANVMITGLNPGGNLAFYVRTDCGVTDGVSEWTGPINFLVPSLGSACEDPIEVLALPYSTSGNTADFGDNYDGSPGSGCGSTFGYLNGDDVVYEFVAGEDMMIDISLSNLSNNYAGIFVYESCADIGFACSEGAVNGFGTADLLITDYPVLEGESYYIVISTWAAPQSVAYKLDITKVCLSFPETPTGSTNQELCIGATLEDIQVNESGVLWYDAGTDGELLPSSTLLTNGTTYYATLISDSCESEERLGVMVSLLDVSDMPSGYSNQTYVEGNTILDLEVAGSDLNWYADPDGMVNLPEDTVLVDQTIYYVGQTTPGFCESPLLEITVHRVLDVFDGPFSGLAYFPNPTENLLTIRNTETIERIEIHNLLGQKIFDEQTGSMNATVDLSNAASGTYLLKITVGRETGVFKIIRK